MGTTDHLHDMGTIDHFMGRHSSCTPLFIIIEVVLLTLHRRYKILQTDTQDRLAPASSQWF